MNRLFGFSLIALFAFTTGCSPNPFCLNCSPVDLAGADLTNTSTTDGPGGIDGGPTEPDLVMPPNGCNGDAGAKPEVCNGIDDDCNGMADDNVSRDILDKDPNNCGKCGNECQYPNAGGLCLAGMCQMGACQPGFYDLDKSPANGCEYTCIPTPPSDCSKGQACPFGLPCDKGSCLKGCSADADCAAFKGTVCDPNTRLCEGETCDGMDNNCNGKVDDGFDFSNDANNCGSCGVACAFPNANGLCQNGKCSVSRCTDGFIDLNKNGLDGCEYKCPSFPPKAETCNGTDDDCDGQIDNNPGDVGAPCDQFCPPLAACVGQGNCTFKLSPCNGKCCGVCTQGRTICAGGQSVCQMGKGPTLEVCNSADDNCDGQIDEGFDLQTDTLNCGRCGNSCAGVLMNAITQCSRGLCAVRACKPGFADIDGNQANGCEYMCPVNPPTAETCNGKDDDCNGQIDENLTVPNNFCSQTGPCAGSRPSCSGMKGWTCNYAQLNARIEVDANGNLLFAETKCDGFDGNCNTQVDESFANLGKACSVGIGVCAGTGTFICDPMDQTRLKCPANPDPNKALDESCNGADDDCDGKIDERTDDAMCPGGRICKGWRDPMVQVGNAWVYQYEAARPDATAQATGGNADRACSKPGVLPWAPVTVAAAKAACAAVRDSQNNPMRLCTEAEWQAACSAGMMGTVWSYAAAPATYQPMVCNGQDGNLNRAWVTGQGQMCYAAHQNNGRLYDMSGNVAEWTSTEVMYNGVTYNKIRGGAYTNPGGGLACNFDFAIGPPNYQFNDLGFRCCSGAAP